MLDKKPVVPSKEEYLSNKRLYDSLALEVEFILRESLSDAGVKIDATSSRVKSYDSLVEKLSGTRGKIHNEINDTVGCRVVCLFRSDLPKIEAIIRSQFNVIEKDDKVNQSTDSFGYMSVHFSCFLNENCAGPRYDKIRDIKFEVQIRTLCMHAWAVVSHYLSYKGEWDVPQDQRKALSALSGLFYVADNEFENSYTARQNSLESAIGETKQNLLASDLNLNTLSAYISNEISERPSPGESYVSELVLELGENGYESIGQIDRDIRRAKRAVKEYEAGEYGGDRYFNGVGFVRLALELANEKYRVSVFPDDHLVLPYLKYVET